MIRTLIKTMIGTRNERLLRGYRKEVEKINALEPQLQKLSDQALSAKTAEFKQRLAAGSKINDLMTEAFAVVREASRRTLKMRHFDVQLIGGMVLHHGKIAEMRTGEGKTLSATLPAYLNALSEKGVHIVTVNDYLAKRDAEWMRPVYEFLGLTVDVNLAGLDHEAKQRAYAADVTYGTNNEFGFDYLRDHMVFDVRERVQRGLNYAIVDEVDSILIDEARTPLIISGQAEASSDLYVRLNELIPQLKKQEMRENEKEEEVPEERRGDFVVDEKNRQVHLTERGHHHVERLLTEAGILKPDESLYDINNITLMHYLFASLRAHKLFQRDVHYVVKNNEVMIVDEHTGRIMPGRRWSDGLHQAVEAKENVQIQLENQTLASITFQNYFRLYSKLSGMTGTADTEAFEFQKIYGLEVVVIPTNKPMIREDRSDMLFLTQKEKFKAILEEIKKCMEKKQPVLVGTASIEASELVSEMLKKEKIPHEVLNAKNHEREAKIIAQAGRPGAVTIATNMAGRGTDIVLGGNLEAEIMELGEDASEEEKERIRANWQENHKAVIESGGLHVLGTERHESRRIDNQLRGRSGRQGDPGSSQFYLSMEDNLLRIFAADRMANMMRKLGIKEGDVIQHPWYNTAIEKAQRRVEGLNFDIRKQLLEYDDVANDQRKVIYQQRHELLNVENLNKTIDEIREESVNDMISDFIRPESLEEEWKIPELEKQIQEDFGLTLNIQEWLVKDPELHEETLRERIVEMIKKSYDEKIANQDPNFRQQIEKNVFLQVLDTHWKDHLAAMDHLRQGIHLRGYAQKNPTQEFKRESFELFTRLLKQIKYDVVAALARLKFEVSEPTPVPYHFDDSALHYEHVEMGSLLEPGGTTESGELQENIKPAETPQQPFVRDQPKIGRNDPCPCGSGKKYKNCHGKIT